MSLQNVFSVDSNPGIEKETMLWADNNNMYTVFRTQDTPRVEGKISNYRRPNYFRIFINTVLSRLPGHNVWRINSKAPLGMGPATFLLVAQWLNQLLHRVPQLIIRIQIYLNKRQLSQYKFCKQDKLQKAGCLKINIALSDIGQHWT